MPKALVRDVLALGFKTEMFGRPDDFASPDGGPVFSILTVIGSRVRAHTGAAVYDAALSNAPAADDVRRYYLLQSAEAYFAGAELWRRREAFADSELSVARSDGAGVTISSRYLENATRYDEMANDLLAEATGKRLANSGGLSSGFVESGPYEAIA